MAPTLHEEGGVKIEIHGREHLPVHVHATYAGAEALVNVRTGEIFEGKIPAKKLKIVQEWLNLPGKRKLVELNFYELNPRFKRAVKEADLEIEQENIESEQE
jgi:hypothetical protein